MNKVKNTTSENVCSSVASIYSELLSKRKQEKEAKLEKKRLEEEQRELEREAKEKEQDEGIKLTKKERREAEFENWKEIISEEIINLVSIDDYETLHDEYCADEMKPYMTDEYMQEAKNYLCEDWGELESIGNIFTQEVVQNGQNITVVQIKTMYENIGVTYYSPHSTNKSKSNRNKHEEGDSRRRRDQGGEKKKQKNDWIPNRNKRNGTNQSTGGTGVWRIDRLM